MIESNLWFWRPIIPASDDPCLHGYGEPEESLRK